MPKLSVVTICYEDLSGLIETGKSIATQGSDAFEWIVVDGGSADGTRAFLEFNPSVARFISEPDRGIYDAMKKGVDLCGGDYILFLNSGDRLFDEGVIKDLTRFISGGDVYFFSTEVRFGGRSYLRKARVLSAARYTVPAIQQSTIYSRSALNGIKWPIEYKICGDYSIAAQLYMKDVNFFTSGRVVSGFNLGGVSTVRPFALAREAFRIQRLHLGMGYFLAGCYFLRRMISGSIVYLMFKLNALTRQDES